MWIQNTFGNLGNTNYSAPRAPSISWMQTWVDLEVQKELNNQIQRLSPRLKPIIENEIDKIKSKVLTIINLTKGKEKIDKVVRLVFENYVYELLKARVYDRYKKFMINIWVEPLLPWEFKEKWTKLDNEWKTNWKRFMHLEQEKISVWSTVEDTKTWRTYIVNSITSSSFLVLEWNNNNLINPLNFKKVQENLRLAA